MKFWVSFLPEEERTLRRDGIHFCNIRYWSDALGADLGQVKGKLLIKYDPRDLSRIFVRRPSGRFVEARYRNLSWPAITLWEQKAAIRQLRAQGRREINEAMIFTATIRQREIEDAAKRKTAAARRRREGRPAPDAKDPETGSLRGIDSAHAQCRRMRGRRPGVTDDVSHLTLGCRGASVGAEQRSDTRYPFRAMGPLSTGRPGAPCPEPPSRSPAHDPHAEHRHLRR